MEININFDIENGGQVILGIRFRNYRSQNIAMLTKKVETNSNSVLLYIISRADIIEFKTGLLGIISIKYLVFDYQYL
jgi:hypothetical protein